MRDSDAKALGQIGFEAYIESTRGWRRELGVPDLTWDELEEGARMGWVDGVHAAIKAWRDRHEDGNH